jgi:hypothetical protein
MTKREIANSDEVTVRVDPKALAIKVVTMVAATGVTMAAIHIVQKQIEKRS